VTFEEALADFAIRASLLRADFFPNLVLSLSANPDPDYQQRLGKQFQEALLRAAAKQPHGKLCAGYHLFAYIVGDVHLYKTINFEGMEGYAKANLIDDSEYRLILSQVNKHFAHPSSLELTSHGLVRSFRFWSLQEKLAYLDFANSVISILSARFSNVCYGFGFMLSYIRDQDFIPHDDDIDILVAVEDLDYPVFEDALRDVEECLRESCFEVSGTWRTHRKVLHNGTEVDVFVGLREGNEVAFFPGPRRELLYSDLFPTSKSSFWGRAIATPQKPHVYLEKVYGPEWRKPKLGWRHVDNWASFAPRFGGLDDVPTIENEAVAGEVVLTVQSTDKSGAASCETDDTGDQRMASSRSGASDDPDAQHVQGVDTVVSNNTEKQPMDDSNASWQDTALSLTMAAWSKGVKHEIKFWRNWLSAKGGQWGWDFASRLEADHPVEGLLATVLNAIPGSARVLDVGAGPLSVVGKTHNGRRIELHATDPLADFYSILNDESGISAPVPTQFSTAEDLSLFFDESSFDVVYCQNALDHSFDPVRAIVEMLRVVKVGGNIALNHHENEAENENYVGFHQFNFSKEDDDFIIWNKKEKLNVRHLLPVKASLSVDIVGENIQVIITKLSEFSDMSDRSRHRIRAAQLLRSLVSHYGSAEFAEAML
jgi:ubiquinone/menaquinone biosynthesis C-methylase UbiE